jgi:predicted permease
MTTWLSTIWSRCRAMVARERLDREFDEELTTHLELLVDEGRRNGLSQADARRAAIRRLGRPEALREVHREQRGMPVLDVLQQDLRYAVRMLWKSPAFTVIVTLSLALGIGANTALFSLVDDLLLRSLPVSQPDRLVQVQQTTTGLGTRKTGIFFAKPVFDYVRAHDQVFAEIVGFSSLDRPSISIDGVEEPTRSVEQVSENFFRDLGVTPILGRTPQASDDAVAIVSYGLWRTRFGSSPSVLGRAVTIADQTCTIIGVAPPRFLGLSIENSASLWISSRTAAPQRMIARLKPGVTSAQAQAATRVLFRQLPRALPDVVFWDAGAQTELLPAGKGLSELRAQYERPLLALTVLVTLVLLITCTNVGNLLIVRNSARRRELALRVALGARRSRLVLQYLIESAVLAAAGGMLGLVFARWGVSIILSMLPLPAIPDGLVFRADGRVLGFAAGVSLLSALLFGLAPAWRATQVDHAAALKSSHGGSPTKSTRRLGRSLVACQVGLSVLLLVGAGLFVQTLRNLVRLDVGFNPDSLLQVSLDSHGSGYREGQIEGLYRLLLERVSAIPGVRSVTGARNPVMRSSLSRTSFRSLGPGRTLAPDEAWDSIEVGPSFFETMNIPVLRGRTFTAADFARGRTLVIVSEAFARHYFPNEDPTVGKIGETIIGVVRDAKLASLRRDSGPMMYFMALRTANRLDALEIRTAGDPDLIAQSVVQEIRRVNPRLLVGISTMRQEIDRSIAKERLVAATSAFFSLLGLMLVSIGIFGVASSTVVQRTNELGIRMALGAGRWSVIRESLRDTMVFFGAGLAAGIIAAIVAVRLTASVISDLLFGLTAADAANIVGAVLLLLVVALTACILPARRATRIDPLAAIRHE